MRYALVFDMDGVLMDSEPFYDLEHRAIARDVGLTLTDAELDSFRGRTCRAIWERMRQLHGPVVDPDAIAARMASVMSARFRTGEVPAMPGAFELMRRARDAGCLIAVATSNSTLNVASALSNNGAEALVDAVATCDMVKNSKPAPDIFLKAAELLTVSPADCLVVEDAPSGVAAARAAGMAVAAFRKPGTKPLPVDDADMVFSDFNAIAIDTVYRLIADAALRRERGQTR